MTKHKFPSPYGDFVFQHFGAGKAFDAFGRAFPSPYGDFVFQPVPPKSLVIPDLSKPIAERRLKFLFQSAAGGLKWASALVRQGAERMRGFLSDGATIFLYSPLRRGFLLCWRFSASSS